MRKGSRAAVLTAFSLMLLCGQFAPAAAARGARLQRRALLQESDPILAQPDFGKRIEGPGQIGSVVQGLRKSINELADEVPRIGSRATSQTATTGDTQAQRRQAVAFINTLPLLTAAITEGGAAANVTGEGETASAVLDDRSVSVAKEIVDDEGGKPTTLGSAASVQGVSVVQAGNGQQASTSIRGRTDSLAGEKVLDLGRTGDGATASTLLLQRAIGEKASARVQSGTLAAVNHGADGEHTNYGGSVQFAAADTEDRPELSTTKDLKKAENTIIRLAGNGNANRYGYTWSNAGQPTVIARGTDNAYAAVRGGEFGTGYHFGGSNIRAITYKDKVEGDPNRVVNRGDGDGKGDERMPAMG